jgi:3-methyladenine DNA glycosylase Mpg
VRIGITHEVGRLLRFFEAGNPFVSGPRAHLKATGTAPAAAIRDRF